MSEETFIVMYGIDDNVLGAFGSLQDAAKFIGKEKEKLKGHNTESLRPPHRFHIYKCVATL